METSSFKKESNVVDKICKNLHRIPEIMRGGWEDLRKKHADGGADMHYIDESTPDGYMTCLKPDGTIIFKKLSPR